MQKDEHQERKMTDMAVWATEQIQRQVGRSLKPKLEVLLAKKVKTYALKTKPSKKAQHYKLKIIRPVPESNLLERSLELEISP